MDKDEYHKRAAELAKTAKLTEICSLKPSHKNHTISNYKARMSNKKSNSFAIINLPGDKLDDDLTTSKETDSSIKNGAFYMNNESYYVPTFSHHIDFCRFDSLNNIVDSNFLDDLRLSYMSNVKDAYENGAEVPETISEKVDISKELNLLLRPESVSVIKMMQKTCVNKLACVFFDPGSDESYIHRRILPAGINGKTVKKKIGTISGKQSLTTQVINIEGIVFPEFSPTQKVESTFETIVFDSDARYDMIIGNNILLPLGIDCCGSTKTIKWMDKHVPYKPPESGLSPQTTDPNEDTSMLMAQLMATHCYHSDPDESLNEHIEQQISHSFNIAESKYDLVPLEHVAKQQQHLNAKQQQHLNGQQHKAVGRGYSHTAPKEAPLIPWQQLAVDLIGPWTLMVARQEIEFRALTIIDLFENAWLARYPRPATVIHDQGTEFTGFDFQNHLNLHGIEPRSISAKNPQANAVCGRMHQTIGNSLRVLVTLNHPFDTNDAEQLVDTAIANAVYAHRCSYHGTITTMPRSLAFHRDMTLPMQADLQLIQQHRQQLIDTSQSSPICL
ncbi:unnamed protein product [Cylindrotheca closterium]|uniref:Integrase catalytic domain-containing protein n=1 Tax=Cylindrotheca closterium TaxID=2856 RepID=A0AAD2CPD8_9STRA|nr:unnamed protein product [Cylindrotheca closterium]